MAKQNYYNQMSRDIDVENFRSVEENDMTKHYHDLWFKRERDEILNDLKIDGSDDLSFWEIIKNKFNNVKHNLVVIILAALVLFLIWFLVYKFDHLN